MSLFDRREVLQSEGYEIRVVGGPPFNLRDLYHLLLRVPWWAAIGFIVAAYLGLNAAFAALYVAVGGVANAAPGSFLDAFFFSVQTMGTIGYGQMYPATRLANALVVAESVASLVATALATGLVFARFSRPRAKIMFAREVVVHPVEGRVTLMARAANARQNVIAEARAKLRLMRLQTSSDGYRIRRIHDLKLVRDHHPIFTLGWNLMHVIDESSPLIGATPDMLANQSGALHVVIEGSDESTAQTMQARHIWSDAQIRWQYRYVDLMSDVNGVSTIDYTHFHEVVEFDDARPYGPSVI
jgi:inward rectifier potassium channel